MPDDLVLLVADKQMAETVRGILSRPRALGIRTISFTVYAHPNKDPGCRREAHRFLRPFQDDFRRGLVLFDRQGCGAPEDAPAEDVETRVEKKLRRAGWEDRARCVVIDPELEVWVWSDSPEVGECLGWPSREPRVQDWLRSTGRWPDDASKPPHPKEALEHALETVRQPRSSALFRDLAESVSFGRCTDPSFQRFHKRLQEWFAEDWVSPSE